MTDLEGHEATCYCGRNIRMRDGIWHHTMDLTTRCYPDDPRDSEMVAEPDPYAGVLDAPA